MGGQTFPQIRGLQNFNNSINLSKKQSELFWKTSEMLGVVAEYFCDGKGNNYSQWAQLISKVAYSYKEVVIIGPEALKYNKKLQQNYFPNVIFQISDKPSDLPLLKDRYFKGETFIYVCENKVCLRPSETPFEALKQINSL